MNLKMSEIDDLRLAVSKIVEFSYILNHVRLSEKTYIFTDFFPCPMTRCKINNVAGILKKRVYFYP